MEVSKIRNEIGQQQFDLQKISTIWSRGGGE